MHRPSPCEMTVSSRHPGLRPLAVSCGSNGTEERVAEMSMVTLPVLMAGFAATGQWAPGRDERSHCPLSLSPR
jgi:hypothetical protein